MGYEIFQYFIIGRWIKWNSFTTKYHVQSGRRNGDPGVNAGHQSSISLSGIWDCSPSVGYHFRYWLHQGEVVSSFLFFYRLSSIDFFPSPPLDFLSQDCCLTPTLCIWMRYHMPSKDWGQQKRIFLSKIRVIFKPSPLPQRFAVLFLSAHTL